MLLSAIMDIDINALVDTYLKSRPYRDEDFWAWEEVHRRVQVDIAQGWEVTYALLQKAASNKDLSYVAAGPLEDFIDIYGHAALDVIEPLANDDKRLQLALTGVCILPENGIFERWRELKLKYGFAEDAPGPDEI